MKITAKEGILTIEREDMFEENYEIKMIKNNTFTHFLAADSMMIDNVRTFEYKISGMISLRSYLEKNVLSGDSIGLFVNCLKEAVSEMSRFMIDYHRIFISVDSVFVKNGNFYFCILPGFKAYDENIKTLLEYMLEHVDYKDNKAVIWMYRLYQSVVRDKISIAEIQLGDTDESDCENVAGANHVRIEAPMDETEVIATDNLSKFKMSVATVGVISLFLIFVTSIVFEGLLPIGRKVSIAAAFILGSLAFYLVADDLKSSRKKENTKETKTDTDEGATMLLSREPPCLIYGSDEEKKVLIKTIPFILGSGKEMVDHRIKNRSVSRLHARIFCEGERYFIEDLGSTNGTRVNKRKLAPHEVVEIRNNDLIILSDEEIIFHL